MAATLGAARQRFRGRRLIAVFEPRSYTAQRREYQKSYEDALRAADHAVVAGLFRPERYDDATRLDPGNLVASLRDGGTEADYLPAVEDIVNRVVGAARPGDVVLVMSNGGFGGIHERLLEGLGAKGVIRTAAGAVPDADDPAPAAEGSVQPAPGTGG